jgi:hypothetical protein
MDRRRLPCITLEGITESWHRSDVSHCARIVAQRRPNFRHQVVQARVGDKGFWPQMVKNLRFRNRLRAAIEEKLKELEGFGGKGPDAAMAKQQALAGIELAFSEDQMHGSPEELEFPENSARTVCQREPILGQMEIPMIRSPRFALLLACLPTLLVSAALSSSQPTSPRPVGPGSKSWVDHY